MAGTLGFTTAADILGLYLNATPIAHIADNASGTPLTNTYMTLHIGSPAGSVQTTNELAYTEMARQPVARDNSSKAWTVVSTNPVTATLLADVTFPAMTAGAGGVCTHASLGFDLTGGGKLIAYGALTPNVSVVANGAPPAVKAGTVFTMT